MPEYKARDIERVLRQHGFLLIRSRGSHLIYRHADGRQTIIPFHGSNRPVTIGVFKAILRQTKLSREDFS